MTQPLMTARDGGATPGALVNALAFDQLRASMGTNFTTILNYFIEDMTAARNDMPALLVRGEVEKVCRIAHTLKSSALMFGAAQLSESAANAEATLKQSVSGRMHPMADEKVAALQIDLTAHIGAFLTLTPRP